MEAEYLSKKAININPNSREARYLLLNIDNKDNRNHLEDYQKIYSWTTDNKNEYYNIFINNVFSMAKEATTKREIIDFMDKWFDNIFNNNKYENIMPYLYAVYARFNLFKYYLTFNREFLYISENYYNKSIENKKGANFYRGLSEVYYNMGEIKKSLEYVTDAINIDDSYIYAYITKGIILIKTGNDDGLKYLEKAIRIRTGNIKEPDEKVKNFIIKKIMIIDNKLKTNFNYDDLHKKYLLSCYYLGYCPTHPDEKTYIILRENKRIVISHIHETHS